VIIVTFEIEFLLFTSSIVLIVIFAGVIIKRKYTVVGNLISLFSYATTVLLVYFRLFPFSIGHYFPNLQLLSLIPGKRLVELDIISNGTVLNAIGFIFGTIVLSFLPMVGITMLIRKVNGAKIWIYLSIYNVLFLTLCLLKFFFDYGYWYDYCVNVCFLIGTVLGVMIGKLVRKKCSIRILREEVVDVTSE